MENGVTHDNVTKNDVKVVVPLKHCNLDLEAFRYTIN